MCDCVSWDVILPQRRTQMGASRPKGSIRILSKDKEAEYVSVPALVARSMARKRKAGELANVTKEDLFEALRNCSISCAKTRIASLVARRDYSRQEVGMRLGNDGFEQDIVSEALLWAVDVSLVSDKRFADSFVRAKISAGWGIGRIERELQNRGVDAGALEGWPHEYLDPDDEYDRALQIAMRKRVKEPNAYAKMVRFVVSRGFSYGIATRVASQIVNKDDQNIWS